MFTFIPPSSCGSISTHNEDVPVGRKCVRSSSVPYMKTTTNKPRVTIHYCTGCRWGLRAAWVAQELLVTFEKELLEVALRPSDRAGVFDIFLDDNSIWSREQNGRFPELKEVKRAVRDSIAPERSLGHTDR